MHLWGGLGEGSVLLLSQLAPLLGKRRLRQRRPLQRSVRVLHNLYILSLLRPYRIWRTTHGLRGIYVTNGPIAHGRTRLFFTANVW